MVFQITPPIRQVNNKVINALLEAFYDVLDLDGKRSILTIAGLETLMETKLSPNGTSSSKILDKILLAMRNLLQYSDRVLLEIGRKFSVYFDPSGSSFEEFINLLSSQLFDIEIEVTPLDDSQFTITMQSKGRKMALFIDPWMRYFYQGILQEGLRKSVGGTVTAEVTACSEEAICFNVKGV
jgi:hypothetical protein